MTARVPAHPARARVFRSPPAPSPRYSVGYYCGRPAATGPVTGRAASSLRSGTFRAMPCVVGDVRRLRCCDAPSDLAAARLAASRADARLRPMSQNLLEAKFCAKPSGSSPARPAALIVHTPLPRFPRPSSAPAELSRLMRRGSPAQSLLAMTTVVARAMKTPARHTGCGKKEQPVCRSPMRNAARTRRARLLVPCPAAAGPRKTAHAPRQRLAQAGAGSPRQVGVPRCRASVFAKASP
jgi:hypothetical protein